MQTLVNATAAATVSPYQLLEEGINGTFLMFAGALVFLMQGGFQLLESGTVAKANPVQIVLKNLLDLCVGAILYYLVGYAFAFGEAPGSNGFIGVGNFVTLGLTGNQNLFWFFQFCFCAATATIVSGAVAERINFIGYLIFTVLMIAWVQPLVAHWMWSSTGFMSAFAPNALFGVGVLDFAGSGVIHLIGGTSALSGCFIMGFRNQFVDNETRRTKGNPPELIARYERNELGEWKMNAMHQHSPVLASTGVFLLAFGWLGFNGGSALIIVGATQIVGRVLICTVLSGAVCSIGCLFVGRYQRRNNLFYKYDLNDATNGFLCGLVIVTGGCAYIETWAALVYGLVGVVVYKLADYLMTLPRFRLDDPVGAVAVHGAGGLAGIILNGLFAFPAHVAEVAPMYPMGGAFYGTPMRLAAQLVSALVMIGWTLFWSVLIWTTFWLVDRNRGSSSFFLLRGLELEKLATGYIDEDMEISSAEDSAVAVGFIDPLAAGPLKMDEMDPSLDLSSEEEQHNSDRSAGPSATASASGPRGAEDDNELYNIL